MAQGVGRAQQAGQISTLGQHTCLLGLLFDPQLVKPGLPLGNGRIQSAQGAGTASHFTINLAQRARGMAALIVQCLLLKPWLKKVQLN